MYICAHAYLHTIISMVAKGLLELSSLKIQTWTSQMIHAMYFGEVQLQQIDTGALFLMILLAPTTNTF